MMIKVIRQVARAFCGHENYPAPPQKMGEITATELSPILKAQFPGAHISFGNSNYELMGIYDCLRFLDWYQDTHPYTLDEYDCNVYAWIMRAEALKWMHGKFVFGYIEAEGIEPEYTFVNHGFCFLVNWNHKIFYMDELCVAAPADDLEPAYAVKAYEVRP